MQPSFNHIAASADSNQCINIDYKMMLASCALDVVSVHSVKDKSSNTILTDPAEPHLRGYGLTLTSLSLVLLRRNLTSYSPSFGMVSLSKRPATVCCRRALSSDTDFVGADTLSVLPSSTSCFSCGLSSLELSVRGFLL